MNEHPAETRSEPGRIFIDLTTAYQEQGRIAHGTTRVERGIAAGLASLRPPGIAACRYVRSSSRFVALSFDEVAAIAAADGIPEARRNVEHHRPAQPLREAGKRLELWLRRHIRDPWRAYFRKRRIETALVPEAPDFLLRRGDTLLVPGELQRHDFDVLAHLKHGIGVKLTFVFYDLLGVLPNDDPRLQDPTAFDIPSSDFMVREADAVLSISDHSKRALLAHYETRGQPAPPIEVFRLGHTARTGQAQQQAVPDLEADRFVLTVGDVVPRKNHQLLVSVWRTLVADPSRSVLPLVIVGRIGPEGADLARRVAEEPALRDKIRFLSNCDDGTLGWLYAHCAFTVFPSLSEGFGLPVAESLAAGKICVASSAASIPEASQGCGIHLDPADEPGWTRQIAELMTDPTERARHQTRVAAFRAWTWQDTTTDIVRFLTALPKPVA
jgi:glycosyltransferase involved in cell wall biosynthesis